MDTLIKRQIEAPEIDWTKIETIQLGLIKTSPQFDLENHVWITARGIEIPVKEMTTNHINNCIKCWNGIGNMTIPHDYLGGKEKWIGIFSRELTQRN